VAAPGKEARIAEWGVPLAGVIRALPAELIPPMGLFDGENMLVRRAVLRTRPGLLKDPYAQADATTGIPTGAFWYTNSDNEEFILVGTTLGIYSFDGSTWVQRTGPVDATVVNRPTFAGTLHGVLGLHPSRFTSIQSGDEIYVLHTNGVDPMLIWNGKAPTFVTVTGQPVGPVSTPGDPTPAPFMTTLATVSDHIMGIVPPYDIRWGRGITLAPLLDQWPQLNFRALADTTDKPVAIEALGTLGAAVYKTDSLWLATFTGGTEAGAFAFAIHGLYEGPAGPAAIINSNGFHLYMTATGRVGSFDGSQHRWVADALWPLLVDGRPDDPGVKMHPTFAQNTFGVMNKLFREAWFFYPRLKDEDGYPRGLVILSLPDPQPDYLGTPLQVKGAFPGSLSALWGGAVTAGLHYRIGTPGPKVAIFGSTGAKALYTLDQNPTSCPSNEVAEDEGKDAQEPFDFYWQHGLTKAPGKATYRLQGIEPFFERDVNYGLITVRPVRSYALEVPGGDLGEPLTVNLEKRYVRPVEGPDLRGRWFSVRFESHPTLLRSAGGPDAPKVRYHGCDLFGNRTEA
jgi:hypothetical protein